MQEIWTPDVYLWNQEEPVQLTQTDTYASVSHTGKVFWVRLGRIKAACKYFGLDKFPFDVLSCVLEFGSWSHSGKFIHLHPRAGVGFTIGGTETAGQSYSEFTLTNISVTEKIYPPFPRAPNDEWPVLLYTVSFSRASEPYVRGFLLLQILLNMCAFACFWIPPYVGERMGLAITSLLATVASDLTVASKLPVTAEVSWFDVFSLISMIFSVSVVFQTAVVIYFHYYTGADLTPTYVTQISTAWKGWRQKSTQQKSKNDNTNDSNTFNNNNNKQNDSDDEDDHEANRRTMKQNNGGIHNNIGFIIDGSASASLEDDEFNDDGGSTRSPIVRTSMVQFAEDEDEVEKRRRRRRQQQQQRPGLGEHRRMSRRVSLPEHEVFREPNFHASIEHLRHDADDFVTEEAKENNIQWQVVASSIDEYSRVIFPILYVIFLATIFPKATQSGDL